MDRILDDDMQVLLNDLPDANQAVGELFDRAMKRSEERYYLAVLDLQFTRHTDKDSGETRLYRHCPFFRQKATQQFAEYLSAVQLVSLGEFELPLQQTLIRRLHMLAYSQFWEHIAVQRILMSLARIALGCKYDPELFLHEKQSTFHRWQSIQSLLQEGSFVIHDTITKLYHNSIRNAFAHSDFFIQDGWLCLDDPESGTFSKVPSMQTTTWDSLFVATADLIASLFDRRRLAERKLIQLAPYPINLPEFAGPFRLEKDRLGHWSPR